MSETGANIADIFRDEATERLDHMVDTLLALESGRTDGSSAEAVEALFRDAHTIKGAAGMVGLDDVRALAHAVEDVLAAVRDAAVFPPELAAPLLRAADALRTLVAGGSEPMDELIDELAASHANIAGGGTRERDHSVGVAQQRQPVAERRPLRVPAEKIDHLLDLVGEVTQYRRRLAHSLRQEAELPQRVADELDAGDSVLDELKDIAIEMRTLPVASITARLPRAVRDLAVAAGKDVELVVTGAETELDRVILESLSEPLVHLLRNAVTHGIETPAERQRAGKPARGRVELRAVARGRLVEIVIADDGRGVSPEVLEEARREGSLADVLARAGFTTAQAVTELAGRGVGVGAVKTYAQSLGGSLEIRSEPGRGTEVVLLLPLALALLEVLLFERGGAVYGTPLATVEEVVKVEETHALSGRPAVEFRGRPLPVADVACLVGAAAPPIGERPPALVVSAGGRRIAVACDALLGEHEIVVKPLGPLFADVQGYLGAAILGDGRIALLLEPSTLTGSRRSARTAPASVADPATGDAAAVGGAAAVTAKILVVEDSFTVRELQRSILEAAGYRVVTARDGRNALEILDREADIALVVTDLEMPGLDGLDLTRAIRSGASHSALPVVIVTSRGSEDDRRRGIDAGADAYMVKRGFDQRALLETVERLVGR